MPNSSAAILQLKAARELLQTNYVGSLAASGRLFLEAGLRYYSECKHLPKRPEDLKLIDYIKYLTNLKHGLPLEQAELCHELRKLGNKAVHDDENPQPHHAHQALRLAERFAIFLQLPEVMAEIEAKNQREADQDNARKQEAARIAKNAERAAAEQREREASKAFTSNVIRWGCVGFIIIVIFVLLSSCFSALSNFGRSQQSQASNVAVPTVSSQAEEKAVGSAAVPPTGVPNNGVPNTDTHADATPTPLPTTPAPDTPTPGVRQFDVAPIVFSNVSLRPIALADQGSRIAVAFSIENSNDYPVGLALEGERFGVAKARLTDDFGGRCELAANGEGWGSLSSFMRGSANLGSTWAGIGSHAIARHVLLFNKPRCGAGLNTNGNLHLDVAFLVKVPNGGNVVNGHFDLPQ